MPVTCQGPEGYQKATWHSPFLEGTHPLGGEKRMQVLRPKSSRRATGVLLPALPALPEFTYSVCLPTWGAKCGTICFTFPFSEGTWNSLLTRTFLVFECLLYARAGHPASVLLVFISLDAT